MFATLSWHSGTIVVKHNFSVLYKKRYQFESTIVTESPQIYMQFKINIMI